MQQEGEQLFTESAYNRIFTLKDLNGSIHVRTDDYLLEIKRARKSGSIKHNDMFFYKNINNKFNKDVDFFCKSELQYYPSDGNPFIGNMLTIKIPLKKNNS